MVQVYLPMGYPLLSGVEFETLIYQGTVVRMYQVPKDPRIASQLMNRRLFGDVAKMRATMGPFAKGALSIAMGSQWTGALLQVIKADLFSWWSDALDSWDAMTEQNQNAWRSGAPLAVTFNDAGRVFYVLNQTIPKALDHFAGHLYDSQIWSSGQLDDCLLWWEKGVEIYKDRPPISLYKTVGAWVLNEYSMTSTAAAGSSAETYFYGKKVFISLAGQNPNARVKTFIDGVEVRDALYYWDNHTRFDFARTGLHIIKFVKQDANYIYHGGLQKSIT